MEIGLKQGFSNFLFDAPPFVTKFTLCLPLVTKFIFHSLSDKLNIKLANITN